MSFCFICSHAVWKESFAVLCIWHWAVEIAKNHLQGWNNTTIKARAPPRNVFWQMNSCSKWVRWIHSQLSCFRWFFFLKKPATFAKTQHFVPKFFISATTHTNYHQNCCFTVALSAVASIFGKKCGCSDSCLSNLCCMPTFQQKCTFSCKGAQISILANCKFLAQPGLFLKLWLQKKKSTKTT